MSELKRVIALELEDSDVVLFIYVILFLCFSH